MLSLGGDPLRNKFDIIRQAALGQATLRIASEDLLRLAGALDPWAPAAATELRLQAEELREAGRALRQQTELELAK